MCRVYRDNWQKEREELILQQQQQQQQTTGLVSPELEVPAATTFYVAQLEERLQNVGYTHGQELQRLRVSLLDLRTFYYQQFHYLTLSHIYTNEL